MQQDVAQAVAATSDAATRLAATTKPSSPESSAAVESAASDGSFGDAEAESQSVLSLLSRLDLLQFQVCFVFTSLFLLWFSDHFA
jgi:hypothetical protein